MSQARTSEAALDFGPAHEGPELALPTARSWLAVASANHVQRGRTGGFMQVCHGKCAPLNRLKPGDRVVYYSPTLTMGGQDKCQSFTALGRVRDRAPYQADMGDGFLPFRRDVDWWDAACETPIRPLLAHLSFSAGQPRWGAVLRFGLVKLAEQDMDLITRAMVPNDRS